MNSQEQRFRHTAVTELRGEVEMIINGLLQTVGQQFEQERQAWTQRIEDHALDLKLLDGRIDALHENIQSLRIERRLERETEAAMTFWQRVRRLVLGR